MNGTIYQRIEDNAHFRELVENGNGLPPSCRLLCWQFISALFLLIAFAPGWLGTPLNPNTSVTRGIPIGVGGNCDLLCSHWYLHLAGERRIRPS